jgi:hypothetical protein
MRRKRLILSTPEWKSTPWKVIPKNLKDVLVDVLVDMPGLLEDFDDMQSSADADRKATLRLELLRKCWECDRDLRRWFALVCGADDPLEHGFPESRGRDIVTYVAIIHGMSLFWTTCLVLYTTLRMASGPQTCLPERTEPRYYARRLAEAVAVLLQPSSGFYGLQSASLPLEIAWQHATVTGLLPPNEALLVTLGSLRGDLNYRMTQVVSTS